MTDVVAVVAVGADDDDDDDDEDVVVVVVVIDVVAVEVVAVAAGPEGALVLSLIDSLSSNLAHNSRAALAGEGGPPPPGEEGPGDEANEEGGPLQMSELLSELPGDRPRGALFW